LANADSGRFHVACYRLHYGRHFITLLLHRLTVRTGDPADWDPFQGPFALSHRTDNLRIPVAQRPAPILPLLFDMPTPNKLDLVVEVDGNSANASITSINNGLSSMAQAASNGARGCVRRAPR